MVRQVAQRSTRVVVLSLSEQLNRNINNTAYAIISSQQDFKQKMIESVTSAIKGKTGQIGDAIAVG